MKPVTKIVIFPKGLDEVSHSITVLSLLLPDAHATCSALLVISSFFAKAYECKKATSDNLVEAVKTVGREKDVTSEHTPSEEFLKAGRVLEVSVSK